MQALGTMEELPAEYVAGLEASNLAPLWPNLRALLPPGRPARRTRPTLWRFADVRPQLLRAGELTPIERAERRVLVLANPGFGPDSLQATASLYAGLQLVLPGEIAANHRHTPSAVRIVVEGSGGYTIVDGVKCAMERGDVILTPAGVWHEHGHEGTGPVVWLDVLDLPLIYYLEASFAAEGALQNIRLLSDERLDRFLVGGLLPVEPEGADGEGDYPLTHFPWARSRASLEALARRSPDDRPLRLAYVNPLNGNACLPTIGLTAMMLRPGERLLIPGTSASAVFHVVEGRGRAKVDVEEFEWSGADTFAVPTHASIEVANLSTTSPAFFVVADDAPLQKALGIHDLLLERRPTHA
jgi:gentisate 1,2-dioxygenase